jgi:FkbM family methyltransferase
MKAMGVTTGCFGEAEYSQRLEELLGESEEAALSRERSAFDEAARGCERRIVIYGAGELGRRTLDGLRANGVEPLAFADRNRALWTRAIASVPVFSPEEAPHRFGSDSVFVVAVWHPAPGGGIRSIAVRLEAIGCRRVVPFSCLFWKYPSTFLPYHIFDLPSRLKRSRVAIRQAFGLFQRGRSQAEFVRQLEFRLTGDLHCLTPPDPGVQYFPDRLFRPRADEYFVDCGAYDGDTLRGLEKWTGGCFRGAAALEADPANFAALQSYVAGSPKLNGRVLVIQAAAGSRRDRVRFAAGELASAHVAEAGQIEVDMVALDEVPLPYKPTYIKMDIEGSEMDALLGAANLMRQHKPLAAICSYHRLEDLWQIPLRIREYMPEARLFLRLYNVDGWDLVCYAVPPDRTVDFSRETVGS